MKMQISFEEKEVLEEMTVRARQMYPNHIVTKASVDIAPAYDSGGDPREHSTSARLRGVVVELRPRTEAD